MKTKEQKRKEAIERLRNAKFENSKLFRKEGNNPDTYSKWMDQTAKQISKLEGIR